jgi:phospholipase/carboxylesterase
MKFEPQGWYLDRGHWGTLDGVLIAPRNGTPSALVTLCHGFGAPGTDLVSLVEELVPQLSDSLVPPAFLFPEGPIDLSDMYGLDGARAWWPLNMAMLAELAATDNFDALRNQVPDGIDAAREALIASIQRCKAQYDWSAVPNIVGGFSQGAMLAVDTVFRGHDLSFQGAILWSGALVCEGVWRAAHAERATQISAFQSHGRQDPILPIGTGRALHDFLEELGWQIDSVEFDGPHTIPSSGLTGATRLIESVVQSMRTC